jgi:chromosomal replication initiation ATPase DnaA
MAEIWNRIKEQLRDEMTKHSFLTWIENTSADVDDDVLIIYSENEFNRDWLERQYKDLIFHTAKGITGETYELSFEIASKRISLSTKGKLYDREAMIL